MRNGIKTKIDQLLSQNQGLIKSGSHMNPMNNFRYCVPDQLQDPDLHQDKHIVDITMNIELLMKLIKYPESCNTRHKLIFADKTMRYTTKLESLIRKICKDQDFIAIKDAHWIDYWLNRFNKYNDDYKNKEYDKFIDKYEKIIIPIHSLFSDTWINIVKNVIKKRVKIDKNYLQAQHVVKEYIIIDRAVISNENEIVRLALDPNTIRTHAKDTFAGIL
ncbi:hypothetical protein RhiirB3_447891 [Rhizophagus irregularis]|nr:hypothetical protein RhiirB3_447891 [Rhizophagus irregularis]